MVLLFLAASVTILSVTVIGLILFRRQGVMPLQPPSLFGSMGAALPSLLLPAVVGIVLIAWLASRITSSVTRSLAECARFAHSLADGRLDTRLTLPADAEAAPLAAALNDMAESLHLRISRVCAHSGALVAIDGELQTGSARMTHAVRLQEADMRRLVPGVVRMEQTLRDVATGMESLLTSVSATADASRDMVTGIERMTSTGNNLGASTDEVRAAMARMTVCNRGIGSTIADLLAVSGSSAASGARLAAIIGQIERMTGETRAIAEGIAGDTEAGGRAVHEAMAGMQAIRTAAAATAQAMENLRKRTGDIGAILAVIEDVAEQTDLLALNATIIAAQAGEMGRDFSVVADEIRELAERTSSSTREIAAVIHGVQEETSRAVEAITQVEERITTGEKLSQHAGTALFMIVSGVQQAALQVGGIARDGMEQARVSREIGEALEQITAMAQRIADSSAEQTRCTELAVATVEHMGELIAQARTLIREQRHTSALSHQAAATMTNGILLLRDAGALSFSGSAAPSATLTSLQASTASGSDAIRTVESSLAALARQIRLLREELRDFGT
jgi:methyl-accepting chemotaxis protein